MNSNISKLVQASQQWKGGLYFDYSLDDPWKKIKAAGGQTGTDSKERTTPMCVFNIHHVTLLKTMLSRIISRSKNDLRVIENLKSFKIENLLKTAQIVYTNYHPLN